MKRSPSLLSRMPPSPRTASVMRMPILADAGGMELEELHVLHGHAPPQGDGRAVAGQGVGVGRDLEHAPHAAGGEQHCLGPEGVDLAGEDLVGGHATGHPILDEQVEDVVLVKELDVAAHALLVERLQDHVPGPVGCIAGAAHRPFAKVVGVAAKGPLGDLAIGRAVKGQAPMLQLVDGLDGLAGHDLGSILVHHIVAALDRVEHVPFPQIFLAVAQRRANASLGSAGVGARGIELAEHGHAAHSAQFQGGPQASTARANDDCIK